MTYKIAPSKFSWISSKFFSTPCRILDVGCGNHSPTLTKSWFPRSSYSGVDRELYNCDEKDIATMERFYQVDLDRSDLSEIADRNFDLIIFAHVVEHISDPQRVLKSLASKLKPGGEFVIVTPNDASVNFPSMKTLGLENCPLNFFDDPTHVKPVPLHEIESAVQEAGLEVRRKGVYRHWFKALLTPLDLLARKFIPSRRSRAPIGLWDYYGFENMLVATRP